MLDEKTLTDLTDWLLGPQWKVSRELRERIKLAFDAEGIEIPFPQQMVWNRQVAEAT